MNISKRLNKVMVEGNLTMIDLARWFNKPFATVRGWVRTQPGRKTGRDMRLPPQEQERVIEILKLIEKRIRRNAGLPVPQFTPNSKMRADSQRIAYLNKLMAKARM